MPILHQVCVMNNGVLKACPDLPFQLHVPYIEMKAQLLNADRGQVVELKTKNWHSKNTVKQKALFSPVHITLC
jgi:hypothetical protein